MQRAPILGFYVVSSSFYSLAVLMVDSSIRFFDRNSGKIETEQAYGERFLRWAYSNPFGRLTVMLAVKRAWFSHWYGWRMDQPSSASKVKPFIVSTV